MDLNRLAVFEAVARTASFTAAARELGLPKSSVSRAIAALEEELDVQLVVRTTRRVSLNAAGTTLFDRLAPLLRQIGAALGEIPEREEQPSGVLRVTAPVDLGVLFLAEAVARYTARYPAVSVELHLTGRVVDLVGEKFDLALRVARRLEDSSLVARRVAPIVFRAYASPLYLARRGSPRTEADLADHDWVVFKGGPQKLRPVGPGELLGVTGRERVASDDLLFVRDALKAGAGVGLLPTFMAEPEVLAGTLARVLPRREQVAGHLHVVTPAVKHAARKVTAFRELVVELLGAGVRAPP